MTLFIGEREITPTIITKGGGSSDKYKVGDRVNDDSDNPVGTVSYIFTDGSGKRYAVVCLDAMNRLDFGQYLSSNTNVTGIPQYTDQLVWSAPETATKNTTEILATATSGRYKSSACSHCRSKTFTIGGITYEGQLPNINELTQIFAQRTLINAQDPTASTYSSLIIPTNTETWSSTQADDSHAWYMTELGFPSNWDKNKTFFVIPVLEIPLEG